MPKLQTLQDVPQKVDNKSIANNNGVLEIPSSYISTIATLLRPNSTTATGGTTQTNGSDGSFDPSSNRTNLNRQVTSGTTNVDFVYQISDFTGTASDFHYKKLIGIFIRINVSSDGHQNGISVLSSSAFGDRYLSAVLTDAHSGGQRVKTQTMHYVPISADDTTITISHVRNDDSKGTEHSIVGYTYIPSLPTK
tara:strand:- start:253 stop:834 length:582 start_codon:yes stop_codon:yes gene_type:complete